MADWIRCKVQGMSIESGDEADEYYVVPEEALQFLPEEWRSHFQAMVNDHRAVLKSGDKELSQIIRISKSLSTLAALKHVQKRLAEYNFCRGHRCVHGSGYTHDGIRSHLRAPAPR